MKPLPVSDFASIVGGSLNGVDSSALITGFALDNREVKSGDLFIAIKGERVDGHDFSSSAIAAGAVAVLAEKPVDGPYVLVPNVVQALAEYARSVRDSFHGPVIGVTGSAGKTTTKELIAAALKPLGPVLKTEGNRNSEFSSPLLWAELEPYHRSVVVEMGMRGFGQVAHLASFTKPTIGVITNIGHSHIEIVGSREGIAKAKAELLEALETQMSQKIPPPLVPGRGGEGGEVPEAESAVASELTNPNDISRELSPIENRKSKIENSMDREGGGNVSEPTHQKVAPGDRLSPIENRKSKIENSLAVIWAEDPYLDFLTKRSKAPIKTFGFSQSADCRIESYQAIDWRNSKMEGSVNGQRFNAAIPGVGRHFALNAAAAILVATTCGVDPQKAASALKDAQFPPMRMEVIEHNGVTIVLDAYNASPASATAAIETLEELPAKGRRIAVLGEMRELGAYAEDSHRQVGAALAHHGIDLAVLYGEKARWIGSAAQSNGMPAGSLKYVDSIEEITIFLKSLKAGDVVLIKGSRALEMERALDYLKEPVS